MAVIRFVESQELIEGTENVANYLESQGIIYENWDISRLQGELKDSYEVTPELQQAIIDVFGEEIKALSAKRGYQSQDIVVLSKQTPGIEDLLVKFVEEHHHTEDEVRFIVDGEGIFTIKGPKDDMYFDVILYPGDLISVPAYTRHWFTLTDLRKVKAIRIFESKDGWVAVYDESLIPADKAKVL
ncbi:cupin domain-containing protein [Tumebacillus flagellatus]|uniref:Acireductone dioxygenase n=1 Tax=Tumebacillus flagellatus TaxID=1157490 RepID=A0A074M832_9BACL|nr:cupin domain-containing protein [Tumebacillus flagellatus]KEO82102.1 acireductone dioxygenase [Tumebacillus flagellatus]